MDVQCARTFLQEMRIRAEDPNTSVHGLRAFLLPLYGMDERQMSAVFRSAAQHFEGTGNSVNLFWVGKRDIPGSWVDVCSVVCVNSFVIVLQFENRIQHRNNFSRFVNNWLKKQGTPEEVIDKIVRWARVFTTREGEAMGLKCESPLEIDAEIRGDFERLRLLARPENEDESRELRSVLGRCTEWMEENDIPEEISDLPVDELFEAIIQHSTSGGASAFVPSDGLAVVDRNAVQLCDVAPEDEHLQRPTGPPTSYGPGGSETPILTNEADDPAEDSCDELERELLVANQTAVPTNPGEQLRLQRRVHEPSGYLLFKTSVELPVLIAHRPKQRMSTDDVAEVLVEQFRKKHGDAPEPGGFKDAMLKIAKCYREVVDEGRLAQRDRVALILPALTVAYKKLFNRKAPTISTELAGEISRVVLQSKCKNCGASFIPSDQSLYDSDANGVEVAVGKKSYNTRDFCEARCEQRWQCFRCRCGRPLQRGRLGWFDPKCSTCGTGRPILGFTEMDNLLRGLDRHQHVKQYYPRF